jgi:hypothetical protein
VAPLVERFAVEKPNLGIGFLALFGFVAAASLRVAWRGTFHNLLAALARLLDVSIAHYHPFGGLADDLRRLDNHVYRWLGNMKDACGHSFIQLCLWTALQLTMIVVGIAAITYELLKWAHVVRFLTSPLHTARTVKVVTRGERIKAAKGAVAHDADVPKLRHEIATLRARIDAQQAELGRVQAIAVPIPLPVPMPKRAPVPAPVPRVSDKTAPRVSDIQRGLDWVRGKVGRLGKVGTVAGLIGLTSAVLGRLGLGWLRCSRVKRVGRNICGMDSSLLDALLVDAALLTITVSAVELAKELQAIEDFTVNAMRGFVKELQPPKR